jgi:Fe-S oxidoreductase
MNEAGVKFAILGNKEKNSGDTPRRLGNEFLFQELATGNIEEFEKNDVTKIVTIDPHAYNIFKNEYRDFGWNGEVLHHTELLYDLIGQGRLTMNYAVNETIVFHDSCYLGRYNDVYDPPREILRGIPGVKLVEMDRNRETGMCCGAGGGLMWMEEHVGNRINVARTEQALATDASIISSGCPYCLTMLQDGTKAKEVEDQVGTFDIAELLVRAVFGDGTPTEEEPVEDIIEETDAGVVAMAVAEDVKSQAQQEVAATLEEHPVAQEAVVETVPATEEPVVVEGHHEEEHPEVDTGVVAVETPQATEEKTTVIEPEVHAAEEAVVTTEENKTEK